MSAEIFPTPLDWVALAVLLVSLLAGFMRGFLIEAIGNRTPVTAVKGRCPNR